MPLSELETEQTGVLYSEQKNDF